MLEMSELMTIKTHLCAIKTNNKLSCPQKCKIPRDLMKFPASCLIILKSENQRKFFCRLFYLDENYNDKKLSYIDDSVEVNRIEGASDFKFIKEIEWINSAQIKDFLKVKVNLYVDANKLDLNLIKSSRDFIKLTKSILKYCTFSKDCTITSDRYGISKIYIKSTHIENIIVTSAFGNILDESLIEVDEIFIEKIQSHQHIQLGGMDEAKQSLEKLIINNLNYLKNPTNLKPQCQVLLCGPMGCGKSSLIHQLASTHRCNIFEITSDIFKPYPGETEEELKNLFNCFTAIINLIPTNLSIILIENVEIFCPQFDLKLRDNSHSSRIASLIFAQLDAISGSHKGGTLVIGTTAKIELVNIALRRACRLGIEIKLDMPNENQRYEIMKILATRMLQHIKIESVEELSRFVAENSHGFVGADLEVLCQFVVRQNQLQFNDIRQLFEEGFKTVSPSVMRDNLGISLRSTMKLCDIGGMENVKKSLLTCILGPSKHADKFHRFGLRSPSGILLYGPSGCCKTTIVKCLAGESKMTLISVSSAEIYSPYVGEAEKFIVRLFNQARMSAPTILFFDEIDTIVGSRSKSNGGSDTHMRILSTLLTEIDGFGGKESSKPVLIIGATNRPDFIDDALMRPGRFDKLIHIPAPDCDYRLQILKFLLKNMPIAADVNVEEIARRTNFFSGADLENLCNEAAMCAATRDFNCDTITAEDFEDCLTFLAPSLSEKKIEFYEKFEKHHGKI